MLTPYPVISGRALSQLKSLPLYEHLQVWSQVSAWIFEYANEMTQTAFVMFVERPFAASHAIALEAVAAAARGASEFEPAGPWAGNAEIFGLLCNGLPCLIAEYAIDMDSIAKRREA